MQNPPASERLRAAGLRATRVRVAILQVLDDARPDHQHLTVATVAARVRPQLGSVSTQAVYDGLGAMTRTGLVRAIEPAGHPVHFETRVEDAHHHLVCRGCGHIADVGGVHGNDPCLTQSEAPGFRVESTEVTFWGLCPNCARPDDHPAHELPNREVQR